MEGSLDEITSRFERSVLTQLYMNYPSTRKLAKRLGVSHTAIANKLREYGLSQQKKKAKSNAVNENASIRRHFCMQTQLTLSVRPAPLCSLVRW